MCCRGGAVGQYRHADRTLGIGTVHRWAVAVVSQRARRPSGAAPLVEGGVDSRQRTAGRADLRAWTRRARRHHRRSRGCRSQRTAEHPGGQRISTARHHVGRHSVGTASRRRHGVGQRTIRRQPRLAGDPRPPSRRGRGIARRLDPSERIAMTFSLSNYLAADSAEEALRRDVLDGLTQTPKSLPPKWFYDSVGSDLFDQITRLPEYYPTRTEAQILRARSAEIAAASGADTLVELGSGTSEKTRMLLDALRDSGALRRFIPFDVDASVLKAAGSAIEKEYPGIEIDAVCGDFEEHLGKIPRVGRRLFGFLGSTIGNLTPTPRADFLAALSETLQAGDSLLLGTDLVKDTDRLVRAYDDSAGVTAQFNRNVLAVVNRELDADFDLDAFEHVAKWNTDEERIEMWLRATEAKRVQVKSLDLSIEFADGE